MHLTNKEILSLSKKKCTGNWGTLIIASLIVVLISAIPQLIHKNLAILNLFINAPLSLGASLYFLRFSRGEEVHFNMLFEGFKDWQRALIAGILLSIILFIGLIFFVVPGIIAALALALVFYILADDKEISAVDALKKKQ